MVEKPYMWVEKGPQECVTSQGPTAESIFFFLDFSCVSPFYSAASLECQAMGKRLDISSRRFLQTIWRLRFHNHNENDNEMSLSFSLHKEMNDSTFPFRRLLRR